MPIYKNGDTSGVVITDYDGFKCVCIGAKDCKAQTVSMIQGEKGSIEITSPVNQMTGFKLKLNDGSSIDFNLSNKHHRLYYEFIEFIRIINNLDVNEADRLMTITTTAAEIIHHSKISAGLILED